MRFTFLSILIACSSKTIPEAAQCGEMEQDIFLSCLDAQCSASYQQSLAGTDACAVDGKTNTISVEASGSCGFSSSGSCFVICDCPDGALVEVDITEMDSGSSASTEVALECLTVDSPEWTALNAAVTQSTAEIHTLLDQVAELSTQFTEQATLTAVTTSVIQALDDRLTTSEATLALKTVVVSHLDVNCLGWGVPWYNESGGAVTYYCPLAEGLDPNDPPWLIQQDTHKDLTFAIDWTIYDTLAEPDCSNDRGNQFCYPVGSVNYDMFITTDGYLVDLIDPYTAPPLTVTIIHDREYFAP